MNGTYYSATIKVGGKNITKWMENWQGSIQWIAQSPYRKYHKRKNWFVGVEFFDIENQIKWNEKDVVFESCKASGPGGQHVNKTESAIRGMHKPSGIQVLTMDSRSQLQNKKLCLERLKSKVSEVDFKNHHNKPENKEVLNHFATYLLPGFYHLKQIQ